MFFKGTYIPYWLQQHKTATNTPLSLWQTATVGAFTAASKSLSASICWNRKLILHKEIKCALELVFILYLHWQTQKLSTSMSNNWDRVLLVPRAPRLLDRSFVPHWTQHFCCYISQNANLSPWYTAAHKHNLTLNPKKCNYGADVQQLFTNWQFQLCSFAVISGFSSHGILVVCSRSVKVQ